MIAGGRVLREDWRVRPVVISLAIHALILGLLLPEHHRAGPPPARIAAVVPPAPLPIDAPIEVLLASGDAAGGSHGHAAGHLAAHSGVTRSRSRDPWAELSIRRESSDEVRAGNSNSNGNGNSNSNGNGNANGNGSGNGNGNGNGIGFGNGGRIDYAHDVPAPPAPRASKARPPKLVWPNRDLDVIDDSYLFVAKVTVDRDGSVVGARMLTTRPGSRGEHAANAIWTFRYAPALDDDGNPVRATIEQPFQVR